MINWTTKRIDQLGRVVTGKTPSSDRLEEFGDKYPFITPSDIPATQKHVVAERYLSERGMDAHKRIRLSKKSICVVCIGATIGKVCMADRISFSNQQVNSIIPTKGEHDADFIYYISTTLRDSLVSFAGGAATPIVNKSTFSSIKLLVPEFDIQRKIAAILSAYDELIQNNQRRIALLEQMAVEIYREWFVRLRFPGYEEVKVIKGVPAGWDVLPFSAIVNINPSERLDKSEEVPFVGMEDLSLSSMFFAVKEHRKNPSGSKFRNRDVLFPRITPSVENGKRGVVMTLADDQVGCGSTEFIVMREKTLGPEHIYFLTCSAEFRTHAELSMTGASGRQRVQEDCFSFFLVKTPPADVRQRFAEVVSPHFLQIQLLALRNENLIRSRDLLLPRLISGKFSVENLDIQFPPGMAEAANAA